MNISDIDLTQKAAKAARLSESLDYKEFGGVWHHADGRAWSPLVDKGDSFDLLIKAKLSADVRTLFVMVGPWFMVNADSVVLYYKDDEQARAEGTRRAIVMQAAAMSEQMLDEAVNA